MGSPEHDHAIRRLLWLWRLLPANLLLMAAVAFLPISRRPPMTLAFIQAWLLDALVLTTGLGLIPLGYFVRMSIFKRHWVGSRITLKGYLGGQRAALMLFWLAGFQAVTALILTEHRWSPGIVGIGSILILLINKPAPIDHEP